MYNKNKRSKMMKKIFLLVFAVFIYANSASAYQLISSKELGNGDAKNQNIVVKCTTPTGNVSNQTCSLRRYVKCNGNTCSGWDTWRDLRNTNDTYSDWQSAANACCRAMGLR
jgi:hypothetical protein